MNKHLIIILFVFLSILMSAQEKNSIMLPPGAKVEVLFDKSDINVPYSFENLLGHPALVIQDAYCVLEDTSSMFYPLPAGKTPLQIQWTIGPTYYSDGEKLSRFYDDGKAEDLIVTQSKNLRFCLEEENNILYFSTDKTLYSLNWDDMSPTPLCSFDGTITGLTASGQDCCVASGPSLYLCNNQHNYKLFTAPEEIHTFTLGPQGLLFYGTDSGLYCASPQGMICSLSHNGVSDVKCISNSLYVTFLDNSAIHIAPASSFVEVFPKDEAPGNVTHNSYSTLRELSYPEELKLSALTMTIIPEKGLGVVLGNMIILLENGIKGIESTSLPISFEAEEGFYNNNGPVFLKNKDEIWEIGNNKSRQIAKTTSPLFKMYPGEGKDFYLIEKEDSSSVYLCHSESGHIQLFVRTEEAIGAIDGNAKNRTVFARGNDIIQYLDGNFEILYSASRQITALCLVPEGLVFSTPYGVYFLSQNKKLKQLFDIGATQLLYGNATLYIVFRSGEICSINPNEFR